MALTVLKNEHEHLDEDVIIYNIFQDILDFSIKQVGIIIPGFQEIPQSLKKTLQQDSMPVHFVKLVPLSLLVSPIFLDNFCKKGHLYMMSHGTKIDTEDCIAILPSGKLIMNLTKDTYERLGLEGKKSQFHNIRNDRYVVVINMLDPSFVPGKNYYERVKWSFTNRLNLCYNMLVSWIPHNCDISSSISAYFEMNDLLSVPVGLKCKTNTYTDLPFPVINSKEPNDSVESCDYEELFDWLGSVSCDCINSDDPDGFLPLYKISDQVLKHCVMYQAQGFILPQTIQKLLYELKDIVSDENIPFGALTVHGFNDTPVTWEAREHGFQTNGDNLYTYVMFPDGTYWCYTAVGALDTYI